jgi:hypothetical protein
MTTLIPLPSTRRLLGLLTLSVFAAGSAGLALGTVSHEARADVQVSGTDLGVLGGFAIANQTPYSGTHIDLGLTGHAQIAPQVNVGFYYQYYWNNYSNVATSHNHTVAAELNYLFDGNLQGLYAGGKAGFQFTGNSDPNVQSGTDLVLGPSVGYDYPIADGFTLGGQTNVLFVTQNPLVTNWNLLAVLKVNF